MHSSRELRSSMFKITVGGRQVRLVDLFDVFGEHDRLGVVISRPCGGVGASALITATITAFYDLHRARGPDFFVYPDYLLFHVRRPLGDHARPATLTSSPRRWRAPAHASPDVSCTPRRVAFGTPTCGSEATRSPRATSTRFSIRKRA